MKTRKAILWLIAIVIWLSGFVSGKAFADQVYTNADVRTALGGLRERKVVENVAAKKPDGTLSFRKCNGKVMKDYDGTAGHQEVCIEVPKRWNSQVEVEAWIGEDDGGYYQINGDGDIATNKWKNQI